MKRLSGLLYGVITLAALAAAASQPDQAAHLGIDLEQAWAGAQSLIAGEAPARPAS